MRKTWFAFLTVLILALAPAFGMAAEGWEERNEETAYTAVIYDPAGLLTENEISEVAATMKPITAYANIAFVTYPADWNSMKSGEEKAKEWGNDRFGSSARYAVFIIDMKTRHLDIWASQSLLGTLTKAHMNSITDNVYRMASRGDYAGCAEETFRQIEKVLKGEKIATPMKYISNAFLAVIVAILGAYVLISAWIRKEQAISMPTVVKAAAAGAATVITAQTLKKVVHHQSSSGGHGGGFGGGGHGGGGGGGGGHGF